MRRTVLAGLAGRTMIIGFAVAAALGGAAAAAATASSWHAAAPRIYSACAKVSVTAKPKLNTQAGSTETLRTTVTSCASKFEVIRLKQRMSIRGTFNGTIELYRHKKVEIVQNIPFKCCGTFKVTDRAFSISGKLLSKASATWTFA
jgi:hypothetical protein